MVKDNISDFINKIKIAGKTNKSEVSFPYSKLISAIADTLHRNGYVLSVDKKGEKSHKLIEIGISYTEPGMPKISDVRRISKYSRRVYEKAKNLKVYKGSLGNLILSTPGGILTDREAKAKKLGGEVLFKIW